MKGTQVQEDEIEARGKNRVMPDSFCKGK